MVLPKEIGDAAQAADAARVKAWLDSGGDINDGDKENYTLIHCCAIGALDDDSLEVTDAHVSLARTLIALGADVNTCNAYSETLVRGWYSRMDSDQDDERVIAMKALIAGVRKYGTYKKYMRAPHREVLAVRGLAQRGKLRTDHPVLAFLAKQGDNGVVWHILTYWRPTE